MIKNIPGSDYPFDYQELECHFDDSDVEHYIQNTKQICAKITKNWGPEKNTEWLIRHYLAMKMIFSASVMTTSCEFCNESNVRVAEHYLIYYSLLSCCRALVYTTPTVEWKDGEITEMTHSKIINIACDSFSKLSKNFGAEFKKYINYSKALRELISYGAPSSGLRVEPEEMDVNIGNASDYARVVCEFAQLNSHIMESSINKNASEFELVPDLLEKCVTYVFNGNEFYDNEDAYRVGYIYRKVHRPYNLQLLMSEGHVEDYFGAWCSENDDKSGEYDPDENWTVLFPVP